MSRDLLFGLLLVVYAGACSPRESANEQEVKGEDLVAASQSAAPDPSVTVQAFLDWYVPDALSLGGGPAWWKTMSADPPVLTPELLEELRRDSLASAQVEGEIVGIDFDPFLASQDPCERYVTKNAAESASPRLVAVHAECAGEVQPRPSALLEVVSAGEGWKIQNVRYPSEGGDLLETLRSLHGSR